MNARSQFPTPVMGDILVKFRVIIPSYQIRVRVPNARASELLDLRPDFGTSN